MSATGGRRGTWCSSFPPRTRARARCPSTTRRTAGATRSPLPTSSRAGWRWPAGRSRGSSSCQGEPMAAWREVELAAPDFAQRVRRLFDAHKHKTIATLRADGSPRVSGIEAVFADGELTFGSMPRARKGADLRRDSRFALHSATVDPVDGSEAQWPGEAKIAGRAVLTDSEGSD